MRFLFTILIICLAAPGWQLQAQKGKGAIRLVVDPSGKGDFRSLQAALNSLPNSSAVASVIFIKRGVYNKKVYIEKHNIVLLSEDREKTVITQECGGADGFSGILVNPAIGYTSDLLEALGGSVILSEFPELCGVEQNISDRCVTTEAAQRFSDLMRTYAQRAEAAGSDFYRNPSPGNIKDVLITDAIKSAGAVKKGGTSPVVDIFDYAEMVTKPGLNLLCTPGNDVESTTAEVSSGANIVLFTSGLGMPTGNPTDPVVKLSSNTALFKKMHDIIDINTGTIIEGEETIEQAGERILDYVIQVASGEIEVPAVRNGQDDFIPWKRGVPL